MSAWRTCTQCGRQFDENYQFCPFDASPLGLTCPKCGRTWEGNYQFCPLDGAALGASAVQPPAPPPEPAPLQGAPTVHQEPKVPAAAPKAPPPPPPRPVQPPGESPARMAPAPFSFEQTTKRGNVLRPATVIFTAGVVALGLVVWYLWEMTRAGDLPIPQVTYAALPSEGRTKGTPVVVKMNQLALFLLDDPGTPGDEGSRSRETGSALSRSVATAKQGVEVRYRVERYRGEPVIFETNQKTGESNTIVTVTEGDLALAGETDGLRLASQWAERLTDAVRIFVFGDRPMFSRGTEFGNALEVMYKGAQGNQGKVSKRSLDSSYERLMPSQRRALETPVMAAQRSALGE
jgi:hypothetical protein